MCGRCTHGCGVRVDGSHVGDACGRRVWAVPGFVQLRSARLAAALRMHASGHGMGLVMRVPLGLSYWASEAR